MALNFPNSPTVGDEFTGGGFTWTWTGSAWEKVAAETNALGTGFSLIVGTSGNTTFSFSSPQPAGDYTVTSQLNDSTFDIYLVTPDNQNAGYTNTGFLEATADFDRVVVYGATNNDVLDFAFRPSRLPLSSGDVADGAAPFLASATPITLESLDDTTTVTGGNFATDVEVKFVGTDAVDRPAKSIVRSSSTQLIVTRPDAFPVSAEPFSMIATNPGITNPSTNTNRLLSYFDAGGGITWVTTSPLTTGLTTVAYTTTLQATDQDGLGLAYSITSGTLPDGLSLNPSTGEISGTPTTVQSQTITVRATDSGGNTADRSFSINIIPNTLTADYLVIAGGGGGGAQGGGGAGGYRTSAGTSGANSSAESALTLTALNNYTVTVGAGGGQGSNSVFHTITSQGGGRGATSLFAAGVNGGSGGGGGPAGYGSGNPGGSGTANQGTNGGSGYGSSSWAGTWRGGGGGGAGGGGGNAKNDPGAPGGSGIASTITGSSVTRAGGGGGNGYDFGGPGGSGGGGNGGANGTANTGGGGGNSASGGSGVVIVRYPNTFTINVGAGLTASTSTVGENKVTTFTAGSGNISFG